MFPLESSEHMILRQTQESWITVIKRQPLPIQKQSLICSQFKMTTKKWQKFCKSFAKDKIPPEQHQETAIRLGKATKRWCQNCTSDAQVATHQSMCPKETNGCVGWAGISKGSIQQTFKVEKKIFLQTIWKCASPDEKYEELRPEVGQNMLQPQVFCSLSLHAASYLLLYRKYIKM